MSASKTVILNETKMWLTCIAFVVLHGGAGIWWAATINANVKLLKEQVAINTTLEQGSYTKLEAIADNAKQDTKREVLAATLTGHIQDASIHHHLRYRVDTIEKTVERYLPMGEMRNVTK